MITPPYRDSSPYDHDDLLLRYSSPDHRLFFSTTTPQTSFSSSSIFSPSPDHSNRREYHPRSLELKHEDGAGQIMGCNNDQALVETGLRFTIWKQQIEKSENSSCCENNNINNDLVKSSSSSSSKIRLVINSNQTNKDAPGFQDHNRTSSLPSSSPDQGNKRSASNDGGGAIIRTCSDCNTTKTPLWRSGPRGPKSLCNACGIRQRKARRAMAAANGVIPTAVVLKTNKAVQQRKIMKATTMKKKCKAVVTGGGGGGGGGGEGRKKVSLEEMKMVRRLSEISSAYQRVFPQDEREAAILLMTLSYGLLSG